MPLSDLSIRNAKPGEKPRKLPDGSGLYLLLNPNGSRWWRFKYRRSGKEKLLSLGTYPDTSLADARVKREQARKLLAAGIDPSQHRKAEKIAGANRAANTLEVIAQEWIVKQSDTWAKSHSDKIKVRLKKNVYPWLGSRPIEELTAPELLSCLQRVEGRGAVESAHRILQNFGQIFRFAIATGRLLRDPSADLRGALAPSKATHRAAITEPKEVGALLRAIDAYEGSLVTKSALRLAPMLFVRPGELRQAEWAEIDLEDALWSIPASRMKMRESHLVPLSSQSVSILKELQKVTGKGRYVFPGARSPKRPMSDNAVLAALRRMDYAKEEMSGHGFRAMARTILDEVLHIRPDYIEHQLAHAVRDPNGRAYNRTMHLPERRAMMQQWSDYLDSLKIGGKVVPLTRKAG